MTPVVLPRDALQSAHRVELCVTGGHRQMVLPAECGNPNVVLGNGSRRRAEFLPNAGAMVCGLSIDLGETGFRLNQGTRAIPRFSRVDPHGHAMWAAPSLAWG